MFLIIGSGLLIFELVGTKKNLYIQSAGIVILMAGIFLINSKVSEKGEFVNDESQEMNEKDAIYNVPKYNKEK